MLLVKGCSNTMGSFMKCSKILRNGKEFAIFLPRGLNAFGWANVSFILRRSFRATSALKDHPLVLESSVI